MKIKSGDIVWQEKTMINDKNYNDNKDCRVSVRGYCLARKDND